MNSKGLQVSTPTDTTIVMTRVFNASRKLVWEAMTKPEWLRRWLFSPPGWTMSECVMDMRVGGKFRWAWTGEDDQLALLIHGEYMEIVPFEKIVHTEHMEMGPGAGACGGSHDGDEEAQLLATLEFIEQGDKTLLRMTLLFTSKAARDAAIASGMEHGVGIGYDTLDSLLSSSK